MNELLYINQPSQRIEYWPILFIVYNWGAIHIEQIAIDINNVFFINAWT